MSLKQRHTSLAGVVLCLTMSATPGAALAQADAGGHMGHHPTGGGPPASSPAGPDAAPKPPGSDMGGMMSGMMGASPSLAPSPGPGNQSAGGASPGSATPAPTPSAMPGGAGMAAGGMAGGMPPASGTGSKPGGGMGGMMRGMMDKMGGGAAKPFYPAMMDMPSLTPDARQFIETEADKRLAAGSEAITTGQNPLHQALSANDPVAMQQAIAEVRQGVFMAESGASALQAVNEAQPPRQIALNWFKGQMAVPAAGGMGMEDGPWGLSWFHVTAMAVLIAFLVGTLLIYSARRRRINGLVERLSGGAAAPPAGKPPSAPTPAAPATAAAKSAPAPPAGAGAVSQAAPPKADSPKKPWSGALRVAAIFRETPNVKTFRLQNADDGEIPFTFLPGQFLTFSAQIDGKPIRRSYTIASSPAQRDYVEITVKREEQGAESRYLHDNIAIGDHLEVSGPGGVFTFTGKETDSIVLISGGVGITPMMCALRYLTDRGYPGDIFFVHGAHAAQDFIFREELEYLQRRHGNAHVTVTVSEFQGTSWTGAKGRISKAMIAQAVPDIARRRVHVCGPPSMMAAVKAELVALGVPKDRIKTEAFGPALGAAPAPAVVAPAPAAAPAATAAAGTPAPGVGSAADPAPAPASPAPVTSAQVEVQFKKSGKSGPLAPDKCVLEAAEAIGVAIDFSCRVGTCGTCVIPLLEGSVTMAEESGLPPEDKARGIILACQAKSAGALVVDA